MKRPLARISIGALAWSVPFLAQAEVSCDVTPAPRVVLRGDAQPLAAVAAQLEAGLAGSGMHACVPGEREASATAYVEIHGDPAAPRIRVIDTVTGKQLERSVDLGLVPPDGRVVATALYVEELLQASWAELVLRTRAAERRPRPSPPKEVQRVLQRALPPPPVPTKPRTTQLRIAVGVTGTRFRGGLTQAGPSLAIGWRALRWLEPSLRVGYRLSPRTATHLGEIETQAIVGGLFLTPSFALGARVELVSPQGVDVFSATFLGHANADAFGGSAVRVAVVGSHGLGLRVQLQRAVSLCTVGRVSWTALPAEAALDGRVVVGIAGFGGEGELALEARF